MEAGMSGYLCKEDMPQATHESRTPIVLDIGLAMKQLEDNPELGRMMNELVFGNVVAEQLAAADKQVAALLTGIRRIVDIGNERSEKCGNRIDDIVEEAKSLLAPHGGSNV